MIPELLDEDLGTAAEISSSLADLRAINERFGGTRTTIRLLQRLAAQCGCRELTLLEVAAGGGDMILSAQRRLAADGLDLKVILLDRMASHLNGSPAVAVCGDALQLPFSDGAFDAVSCSLFAHHLEPHQLRQFMIEALRVSRRAVLINDLIRSRLHLWLVYAALPLFGSRITRHDAPASVQRSYTVEEMRGMVRDIPGMRLEISRHYLYRMGVLLRKSN